MLFDRNSQFQEHQFPKSVNSLECQISEKYIVESHSSHKYLRIFDNEASDRQTPQCWELPTSFPTEFLHSGEYVFVSQDDSILILNIGNNSAKHINLNIEDDIFISCSCKFPSLLISTSPLKLIRCDGQVFKV